MDERLRGKGNYSFDDLMNHCAGLKETWFRLETLLENDYQLIKLIIKNSKLEGWGINYRVNNNSLCYIHPEKNALVVVFHIREKIINDLKSNLSEYALKVWHSRYPCGKGGWVWYKIINDEQIFEVRKLLNAKINPKR